VFRQTINVRSALSIDGGGPLPVFSVQQPHGNFAQDLISLQIKDKSGRLNWTIESGGSQRETSWVDGHLREWTTLEIRYTNRSLTARTWPAGESRPSQPDATLSETINHNRSTLNWEWFTFFDDPNISEVWVDQWSVSSIGGDSDESSDSGDGGGASDSQPTSRATQSVSLESIPDTDVVGTLSASVPNGRATINVIGPVQTTTVFETNESVGSRSIERDVSEFAGQNVTVELVTNGTASLEISELEIVQERPDFDSDGIPDQQELEGFARPTMSERSDGRITTDPFDRDTDNDGLPDKEEVGVPTGETTDVTVLRNGEFVTVEVDVFTLPSNPDRRDTDRDGLPDGFERRGWTINVTTSVSQSDAFEEELRTDGEPLSVVTERAVNSDPRLADTDGDGIGDFVELENGTDPAAADTDGDGITDLTERRENGAPALYDNRAPTVVLEAVSAEVIYRGVGPFRTPVGTNYTATWRVSDPAGVREVALKKTAADPVNVTYLPDDDNEEVVGTRTVQSEDVLAAVGDSLLGARIGVYAKDENGNSRLVRRRGPDAYGRAATLLTDADLGAILPGVEDADAVVVAGFLSGTTYGAATGADSLVKVVQNPPSLEAVGRAFAVLTNTTTLRRLPSVLVSQVQVAQDRRNPFEKTDAYDPLDVDDEYTEFANGWYAGSLFGTIGFELALSRGLATAARGGRTALAFARGKSPLVDDVARVTASGLARGKSVYARGQAFAYQNARRAVQGTAALGRSGVQAALARTGVVKQVAVSRTVRRLDGDRLRQARQSARRFYGAERAGFDVTLTRTASTVTRGYRRVVTGLSTRALRVLISDPTLVSGADAPPAAVRRQLFASIARPGGVSIDEAQTALRRYDEVDAGDKQLVGRTISEGGANGIRLLNDLNDLSPLTRYLQTLDQAGRPVSVADGTKLISRVDDRDALRTFFEFDFQSADQFRGSVTEAIDYNEFTSDQFSQLMKDLKKFDQVQGVSKTRFARNLIGKTEPSNLVGNAYEARSAVVVNQRSRYTSIRRLNTQISNQGDNAEIDIEFTNGDVAEVRSSRPSVETVQDKIIGIEQISPGRLDSQTYTIIFPSGFTVNQRRSLRAFETNLKNGDVPELNGRTVDVTIETDTVQKVK
jgi:hypothetical protein